MISEEAIRRAARLLAEASGGRVILFGSYARGTATEASDADFLVIEPEIATPVGEMARLRRALRPLRMAADVMVASTRDVEEWGALPGTALYWALREGKVLADASG